MAVTTEQIEQFQQFAMETINKRDDLSFDELVELWMLSGLSDSELQESVAAVKDGLADVEAGRTRPASEVFDDLELRYSAESPQ